MTGVLIPSIRLFPTRKPARVASVALRQIRPDDAAALQDFARALSPASRQPRFHAALNELPDVTLQALTCVVQRTHVAFVRPPTIVELRSATLTRGLPLMKTEVVVRVFQRGEVADVAGPGVPPEAFAPAPSPTAPRLAPSAPALGVRR